jgi:hypothetical protein
MSEPTNTNGTKKKPSHIAYQVRDGGNDESYWDRVGVAWPNKNGSITVQLHAVPLSGKIVLQPPKQNNS